MFHFAARKRALRERTVPKTVVHEIIKSCAIALILVKVCTIIDARFESIRRF